MKTKSFPRFSYLLVTVTVFAIASLTRAGTVFFDFNSDPTTSGQLQLFGNAQWVASGGVGAATNTSEKRTPWASMPPRIGPHAIME